jgi:hypothetical protein
VDLEPVIPEPRCLGTDAFLAVHLTLIERDNPARKGSPSAGHEYQQDREQARGSSREEIAHRAGRCAIRDQQKQPL